MSLTINLCLQNGKRHPLFQKLVDSLSTLQEAGALASLMIDLVDLKLCAVDAKSRSQPKVLFGPKCSVLALVAYVG